MEFQLSFSPTTFIFLMVTILFLLSLAELNKRTKPTNLPPGPWKLPIIGSMHHLLTGLQLHHTLSKLSKRYGPLMHLKLGEITVVVVSSPQMAKTFLKTHEHAFLGRPSTMAIEVISYNNSEIAFSPFNDHWRQMRKICVYELLSNTRVKSFESIRKDEVFRLVACIRRSNGLPIDLSGQLSLLTSSIICRAAFGENLPEKSSLIPLLNEATASADGLDINDFFPSLNHLAAVSGMKKKLQKIQKKIDIILDGIIKKRREYNDVVKKHGDRRGEKEDLLDVLLRLHHENEQKFPITDNIIKAVIVDMFVAGTETSASIIEWAMSEMIKNPRVMVKAQSKLRISLKQTNVEESDKHRLGFLNHVIKETLRLHPPFPVIPRECIKTWEIHSYTIPEKCRILVNVLAMGRDPEFWEDADKFIPERFEKETYEYNGSYFEYIPFGTGRRICPGTSFGLATVELCLTQLLYHFSWKLPDQIKPEELDMSESAGMTVKKKNPLYLVAELNEASLF